MRVLFLTPSLPSPPVSGGTARMHGLISRVAKRHEVAVLAYRLPGVDASSAVEATGEYARLVVTVENPYLGASGVEKRRGQLRSLARRNSYEWMTYRLERYQRSLERVVRRWMPDAIVVEFAQMGFFEFPPGIPVILDAHNVEHEIVRRMAAVEPSLSRRVYSRINAAKLRREEAALAGRVDAVAVTSERDGALFEMLAPGLQPFVVPNGVDCELFSGGAQPPEPNTLIFFGALDYFPNADAVRYFHQTIWPQIRQNQPAVEWRIVGRMAPADIQSLGNEPGIVVTGYVENIRDWIERSSVVVVPLRAGSGTRLKVLEAMAMGKPIVSTSLGAEGLDVDGGLHLVIADQPADFAMAVLTLLASGPERERLGAAARALAECRYDWQAIADRFEGVIEGAVQERRQR